MNFMLVTQRLAGRMSGAEARDWRVWRDDHRGALIDPAVAPGDPLPTVVDAATQIYQSFRHPRAFIRNVVFDSKGG